MSREELQFTQDWLYRTEDFSGIPPLALDDWVDFSVADEVLAEVGTAAGADQPAR
jgi:hypothetical protein